MRMVLYRYIKSVILRKDLEIKEKIFICTVQVEKLIYRTGDKKCCRTT